MGRSGSRRGKRWRRLQIGEDESEQQEALKVQVQHGPLSLLLLLSQRLLLLLLLLEDVKASVSVGNERDEGRNLAEVVEAVGKKVTTIQHSQW